MRILIGLVFFAGIVIGQAADAVVYEAKLSSDKKEFSAAAEVKTLYLKLVEGNPAIGRLFEQMGRQFSQSSPEETKFGPGVPQVVPWYPSKCVRHSGKDMTFDGRFLVVQALEFSRSEMSYCNYSMVAEFRVIQSVKYRESPARGEKPKLDSDSMTIQFLGFRQFVLSPFN